MVVGCSMLEDPVEGHLRDLGFRRLSDGSPGRSYQLNIGSSRSRRRSCAMKLGMRSAYWYAILVRVVDASWRTARTLLHLKVESCQVWILVN